MTSELVYYDCAQGADGKWFIWLVEGDHVPRIRSLETYETEAECLQALESTTQACQIRMCGTLRLDDSGFPDASRLLLK